MCLSGLTQSRTGGRVITPAALRLITTFCPEDTHIHIHKHTLSHTLKGPQRQTNKTRQEFVVCKCEEAQRVQATSLQNAAGFQLASLERPVTGGVSGRRATSGRMNAFIGLCVCVCVCPAKVNTVHSCKLETHFITVKN